MSQMRALAQEIRLGSPDRFSSGEGMRALAQEIRLGSPDRFSSGEGGVWGRD